MLQEIFYEIFQIAKQIPNVLATFAAILVAIFFAMDV